MTLRQEAVEKMALLPEAGVRVVLAMVDEMLRQNAKEKPNQKANEDIQRRRAAFKAIIDMRARSPFPADFDYDKARAEALTEKYGRFA